MSTTKLPFSVDDLYCHQKIEGTSCTADGRIAVCALRSVDRERDSYVQRLWAGEGKPSCREDAAQRIVDWATRHVDQDHTGDDTTAHQAKQPSISE